MAKPDFVGRDAVLAETARGPARRLVPLLLDEAGDADAPALASVFAGGERIGLVTSGGWSHTLGRSVALAYRRRAARGRPARAVAVDVFGERRGRHRRRASRCTIPPTKGCAHDHFPRRAEVVVIGGGIVGCSIAYHLALRGVDVLLLERRQLTCGTTWHAAGLVGQLRATQNLTRLAQYSAQLYETLTRGGTRATGYRRTGSISLAGSPARLHELRRQASMAGPVRRCPRRR